MLEKICKNYKICNKFVLNCQIITCQGKNEILHVYTTFAYIATLHKILTNAKIVQSILSYVNCEQTNETRSTLLIG